MVLITMDTEPVIRNDRTMIPVRYVGELLVIRGLGWGQSDCHSQPAALVSKTADFIPKFLVSGLSLAADFRCKDGIFFHNVYAVYACQHDHFPQRREIHERAFHYLQEQFDA